MTWPAWGPCDEGVAASAWDRLVQARPQEFAGARPTAARTAELPFYGGHRLLELTFARGAETGAVYGLHGPDATRWLDGDAGPVYAVNDAEGLALSDSTVGDYVRLFLWCLRYDGEPFTLVESADELSVPDGGAGGAQLTSARSRVAPLTVRGRRGSEWTIDATVARGGALFSATFAVSPDGSIEMTDDDPICTLEGITVPASPSLTIKLAPSDREVTEAIVSVLLETALATLEKDGPGVANTLLSHFNATTVSDNPVRRLARMVSGSWPVIIIESDIPFVEEFVAGLIDGPHHEVSNGMVARASEVGGDEMQCQIDYRDRSVKLHLVSFHAFTTLFAAERTAHELAIADAAVLVGCDRAAMVPEPLRRICDLTIRFPRLDPSTFIRIFESVFQRKPLDGWDASGADWAGNLVPADFHMPRRLGLGPDEALQFLRDRADARLRQVTPDTGPALRDLHGLGEARQICEDLIGDIRAAQAGEVPWAAVDRGLLMVGAPGTGKTTLARAVAKECGIKFINASAAGWGSAGALDSHLRAMRADFTQARRYAPSILFIDEIDSIGSRERLDDRNAAYQTAVIDALLEQIQGIGTDDHVMVIGATNYADRVDPALRRSGRLDQTVEIPLPNVAALEQIFTHYLAPYRDADQVARDVEARTLAELSLGMTGADVEYFVRGAYRRARRAGRAKITQADLLAEVTHRPRDPGSVAPLRPAEMRRVAVHESGHALSRLISSTGGADITFVTIIPRLDGSLGFVASMPDDAPVLTRRDLMERLETALAGRAAEEVVFGPDDVSSGAGGPAPSSDLAVATRLATFIVCQSGLGGDGAVRWSERPGPEQDAQIDKLLSSAYSAILARIEGHRPLLDRVTGILMQDQEVSGRDLRRLLKKR